jgi:hypothetical protein
MSVGSELKFAPLLEVSEMSDSAGGAEEFPVIL